MKLFHGTDKIALLGIMEHGLIPDRSNYVYLSPRKKDAKNFGEGVLLEVDTKDGEFRCFEDCSDWEVLHMGHIPPEQIQVLDDGN